MDIELLSLLKPQSGEGEGNWGDRGHWSLHLLLCPWPVEGHWGAHSSSEPQCIITSPGGEALGGIKLKRLLGWQINLGTSWSSRFYSII